MNEQKEGREGGGNRKKRTFTPLHLFSDEFQSSGLSDTSSDANSMPLSKFISDQVENKEIKRKTKHLDCEYPLLSTNANSISPRFSTEKLSCEKSASLP